MEYMTYKEFEREINEMGYTVETGKSDVIVKGDNNCTIVTISHKLSYVLDLDWDFYRKMFQWDREKLANLSWRLTSTPMRYREELKKYRLKVYPKYSPFFNSDCDYLNIDRDNEMVISTKHETSLYKTIFTEEKINELSKEYDLSLFEKVEVE